MRLKNVDMTGRPQPSSDVQPNPKVSPPTSAPISTNTTSTTPVRRDVFANTVVGSNLIIDGNFKPALRGPTPPTVGGPQPTYGTPEFEKTLDGLTDSVVRSGNNVTLLFDGVNSYAERNRLIDAAQSSINLQTFILTDDATGWDLAKRLARKATEGVKVRLIYDALGSARSDKKIFDFMRQHGVDIRAYGDPVKQFWDVNDRWHEKHLIVDGKFSIEGGMNIADEYALGGTDQLCPQRGPTGEPWRDVDARVEGPAVNDAQEAFLKNWKELGPDVTGPERESLLPPQEVKGGSKVRVVQHRPDEEGDDNTHQLYLQAVRSATKSITIENAYFLPPKDLREALCDAARRGVDVKVLLNSRASTDFSFVWYATSHFYKEYVDAGVKLFEKHGPMVHAKTAAFDGVYSIVGSVNLNGRSRGRDSETALAIEDTATAAELEARFESGLAEATLVTEKDVTDKSLATSLKQYSLSLLSWTF